MVPKPAKTATATMQTLDEIREIVGLLGPAGAETYERRQGGNALRLRFAPHAHRPSAGTFAKRLLLSPASGVLRLRHPLGVQKALCAGEAVMAGQALAWIECGGALVPLKAPAQGHMLRLLPRAGETVSTGCPLAEFAPAQGA